MCCSVKKTTMAAAAVPAELVEDILLKLPVKSLLRFKTASKKWYSLLSQDHNFAKIHLKQSECENLIFYHLDDDKTTFKYSNIDDINSSQTFNFPDEIGLSYALIGSANGLICVAPTRKGGCFIWNPCTGESKQIYLPIPRAASRLFGFGYDSCSDNYKIVGDWGKHFQVFSLKTNSWRMLEYSYDIFKLVSKAVHLNGVLYWCLGRRVAAFDLAKEKFYYLEMLKDHVEPFIGFSAPLFDYQGSLCASSRDKSIWVMKEYGESYFGIQPDREMSPDRKVTWTKLRTFVPEKNVTPVFCTYDIGWSGVELVKSDSQGRISDDELRNLCSFKRAFVYRESLISPKCFDCLHPLPRKMIKRPRKQRKLMLIACTVAQKDDNKTKKTKEN